MVTEPLQRVRRTTHDIPLTFGIRDALERLAELPPSVELPYLTVCLDWTPAGGSPGRDEAPVVRRSQWRAHRDDAGAPRRPARTEMEHELRRLIAEAGPRGAALDNLNAAAERIAGYLDTELDPSAQGVYIVANAALETFETIALGLPLETAVHLAPTPVLTPLARKVDDHPAYMVLLADQQTAELALIRRARRGRSVWMEATSFPRRTQRGALNQARYQRRVDERISAFARHIADETLLALQREEVDMLILAGSEVMTSALAPELHHTVHDAVIDTIRMEMPASEQQILDATLPIVAAAERARELEKVDRIAGAVAANGRGAAGAEAVLKALRAGQASGIAMVDDFAAAGWADFGLDLYGVGAVPAAHPAGGKVDDLVPITLADELIRLAVQTSARIEIVKSMAAPGDSESSDEGRTEAAQRLDTLGGVGATLRYVNRQE